MRYCTMTSLCASRMLPRSGVQLQPDDRKKEKVRKGMRVLWPWGVCMSSVGEVEDAGTLRQGDMKMQGKPLNCRGLDDN